SPGKCLTAVASPAAAIPLMKAVTLSDTCCGSEPYPRPSAAMGLFCSPTEAGTTSATGARSTVTPAWRSCSPHCWACRRSSWSDSVACVAAEGISLNPGPLSRCTCPPSWSAPTRSSTPSGPEDAWRTASVYSAVWSTEAWLFPTSTTPPVCVAATASSSASVGPPAETPIMNSCPTSSSKVRSPGHCAGSCEEGDCSDAVGEVLALAEAESVGPAEVLGSGVGLPAVVGCDGEFSAEEPSLLHPASASTQTN